MTQGTRTGNTPLLLTAGVAALIYLLLSSGFFGLVAVPALTKPVCATIAVAVLMAGWWITEALPLAATSLLPIALFPLLGAASIRDACSPYANKLIFLFLGGFLIAIAMQRWDLHRRFALTVLGALGTSPSALIAGFMGVTALLSMWVSNTATVVMMLPIAMSVIERANREGLKGEDPSTADNFDTCLLLGLAYAASIGGLATLIGTPPNALLAAFINNQYGQSIDFSSWMVLALPMVVLLLPLTWLLLTRCLFPVRLTALSGSRAYFRKELRDLGPMKSQEWAILAVFLLAAAAWIGRPLINRLIGLDALDDAGIAMTAALVLFILPAGGEGNRLLEWSDAKKVPWGVLILFGGGLSLASAMQKNGVTELIGRQFGVLGVIHPLLLVLIVATALIFLTEITSNTATAAAFLPILGGIAVGAGLHPYLLLLPATFAVSCAFMLPVATPPNALVFASERVTIPQMCRAGIWLNMIGILLISAMTYFLAGPLLGMDLSRFPDWAR